MATIRPQRTGQGHERRILLLFEDEQSITSLVKTLPGVMWNPLIKGWQLENRKLDIDQIERPRREHKLPDVLSKEEVGKMLKVTENLKHKCLIALIYSCGLRRSEAINLRLGDIDSGRMLIKIRNTKWYKDRYVQLSTYLLLLLKDYYKEFRPKDFLFEGQNGTPFYSGESIDKIMTYLKTVPEGWVSHPKWRYIPTYIMKITQPGLG
jgi:integrase